MCLTTSTTGTLTDLTTDLAVINNNNRMLLLLWQLTPSIFGPRTSGSSSNNDPRVALVLLGSGVKSVTVD